MSTALMQRSYDFWQQTESQWNSQRLSDSAARRERAGELSDSEIMTILIHFHQSQYPVRLGTKIRVVVYVRVVVP